MGVETIVVGNQHTVIHVDVDAFFASVEQVLNPDLKGKPVIVGGCSTDRSVVASASYEARAFGVRSAMPIAAARRLCPQAVFLRGDHRRYEKFSCAVEKIIRDFSPRVQKVSLDDFYVDMTGLKRLFGPHLPTAERCKERIRRETGLNVSMGIASNRLVAKIASKRAKPNGIVEIWSGYEGDFLRPLDVDDLPGVGDSTRQALLKFNLRSVGDLARVDRSLLEATFGATAGAALWRHARGMDDSPVCEAGPPKSISRETTFEQDVDDRRALAAMLYYLTERAARHLRALDMQARCVSVKLRYSDFDTSTRSRSLDRPTDHDKEFYDVVRALFDKLHTRRMRVRLVGVCLSSLTAGRERQSDFIGAVDYVRWSRIYRGLDRMRDRFGFGVVNVGPSIELRADPDGSTGSPLPLSCAIADGTMCRQGGHIKCARKVSTPVSRSSI